MKGQGGVKNPQNIVNVVYQILPNFYAIYTKNINGVLLVPF